MQNNTTQELSEKKCLNQGCLVLLRHGQTAWSVSGQHTGRTDLPLTEVGVEQAKEAGARLQCRTQKIIDMAMPKLKLGKDVLVVAHAHVLRILTSRWLGVNPDFARLLRMDTAHYSVLGEYKGDNVIVHWNC